MRRLEFVRTQARSHVVFHAVHEAHRRAHSLEPAPRAAGGGRRGSVSGGDPSLTDRLAGDSEGSRR
jgi:hypothetical protein